MDDEFNRTSTMWIILSRIRMLEDFCGDDNDVVHDLHYFILPTRMPLYSLTVDMG